VTEAAWLRVEVEAPAPLVAALEGLLEALGAVAVTLADARDQPLLEPAPGEVPLWRDVVVSGLFPAEPDPRALLEASADAWRAGSGASLPPLRFVPVTEGDWADAWRQHAVRLDFPGVLHLRPDDDDPPPEDGGVVVRLAPGLAFGTGGHATTRGCLAALAAAPPAGRDVLDFGCGSGVLAIAALALGATRAVGVDHDPQALAATRENAARNGVLDRLLVREQLHADDRCDLLLANVLAGPLVELAPTLMARVRTGGRAVLSGILPEQAEAVRSAWSAFDLSMAEDEGWVVLAGPWREGFAA
jgi:ribosomal protein L11 methyltransferase